MALENLQVLTIGVDLGENDGRLKLRIDANVVDTSAPLAQAGRPRINDAKAFLARVRVD